MRSRLRVRKAHPLELPTRQTMCEVICERGAFCFASGGCPTADIDCADYMTCAKIYGDSQDDDIKREAAGGNVEEGSNDNDDDEGGIVFKADIDDACINFDPAKESTTDSKCAKLCADVGCCFLATGCDKEISCGVYKECDIIYATGAAREGVLLDGSKTDGTGDDNVGLVFRLMLMTRASTLIRPKPEPTVGCVPSSVPTPHVASLMPNATCSMRKAVASV